MYPLLKVHWNISSLKVQVFFNTPATYFLKYFRAKFHETLMSGSQEIGVLLHYFVSPSRDQFLEAPSNYQAH